MGDTNYIGAIVKILETPKQKLLKIIFVTRISSSITSSSKYSNCKFSFWGNLANDVANYYKTNDYILIEGYLSLRKRKTKNSNRKILKSVEITVLKVYPFFFTNRLLNGRFLRLFLFKIK
jgi:single-stranded DNA-binding protein